ncbi:NADH dehydrogenase (ubiquinone) 1 alpha subcomplex 9 [Microbotryum lychnidis-dioicae p1A1 Lamole]|uniref:NADH dehydrogenase (Ubiquinone) 1 alpha subcomplex 9 n=1 Tax=Microbotryum lychnidis-dioicae (strain p1A1 Lamole / MvSl-1064) TaxID=683840 RepID=U5H639_USTV1|nr:NADH dehydrogenase (ubiquinone) 1 alpha subcomplex 9 [Microbotryum lychnidis-dioicae p1A1 Lamole]|eukprot:KDE07008.1 NADH dehydrogenase (ubiquinone) 1 alpha subcomplex 9 [Microbotryum lychnidis-dioicae p1A1 Lamole]
MASRVFSSAAQLARSTPASTRSVSSVPSSVIVPATQTKKVFTPKGPGGRHSSTGHVATVFGATGFLGRYLVSKLAKAGTQVVVPYRDQDEARHLKVCGDLGQVVPMEWDLKNDTQIEECLRHSDTVYNLVGRDYTTKNFSFDDVHVSGARRLARIAHISGVSRFIHLSHLNAAPDSASQFYRTKFHGEQAVKEAFPEATIVRPGWMYGHEDRLLNTIAVSPSVFRVNHGETRIAPVHVMDVAQALSIMLTAPSTASSTFAFTGPQTYTFEQLLHLVEALTLQKLSGPNFPKPILALAARLWDLVWWPTLSPDEVTRRFIDDVQIEEGLKGFKDLGIEPDVLEDVAIVYLRRYRSSSYFDLPVASGGIKLRSQKYHVVE